MSEYKFCQLLQQQQQCKSKNNSGIINSTLNSQWEGPQDLRNYFFFLYSEFPRIYWRNPVNSKQITHIGGRRGRVFTRSNQFSNFPGALFHSPPTQQQGRPGPMNHEPLSARTACTTFQNAVFPTAVLKKKKKKRQKSSLNFQFLHRGYIDTEKKEPKSTEERPV